MIQLFHCALGYAFIITWIIGNLFSQLCERRHGLSEITGTDTTVCYPISFPFGMIGELFFWTEPEMTVETPEIGGQWIQ